MVQLSNCISLQKRLTGALTWSYVKKMGLMALFPMHASHCRYMIYSICMYHATASK